MSRSKSSQQWMQEHFHDEYVKKAQALGYRSRAVFKLQEIQEKDHLISLGGETLRQIERLVPITLMGFIMQEPNQMQI